MFSFDIKRKIKRFRKIDSLEEELRQRAAMKASKLQAQLSTSRSNIQRKRERFQSFDKGEFETNKSNYQYKESTPQGFYTDEMNAAQQSSNEEFNYQSIHENYPNERKNFGLSDEFYAKYYSCQ